MGFDNRFRYDFVLNEYIYNLSTKKLTSGTWRIKVALDDRKIYEVDVSVRK